MSDMQTLLSEFFGMERGLTSDKKHLTALQFKNEQLKNEVNNREEIITTIEQARKKANTEISQIEAQNQKKTFLGLLR